MSDKLHIAVACGGTGGHIFPGLATARALRDQGHHVTLWLAGKGVENTALQGWKGPVVTIPTEGFQFGAFRSILTAVRIGLAVIRCWIGMFRHRPDAVLAMGSYASIGPCCAAWLHRIPYILHEANAVPGRAVRMLSRNASGIGICFEETRFCLKGRDAVELGMPLRPELKPSESQAEPSGFTLLVTGGSAGAHAINELVSQAICLLTDRDIRVIHLTGPADEPRVAERYAEAGIQADVHAFVQEMAPIYEQADLAICRAGASTCAELGVFGIPALFIPYPTAVSDHQTANAKALEKLGAADWIQQADLTVEWLSDYLRTQMDDSNRLEKMKRNARRMESLTAALKLAELVEQCARK
jgi:UDP-N-acetylglucosamine--N-acetylmuramyl-(pentapeptide) pyrophosphoryl-undecaprenol N-acetylglucosamine transferase